MMFRSSPLWLLLALLLHVAPGYAGLQWQAESLDAPGLALRDLSAVLDDVEDGAITMQLKAGRLNVDALGWRGVTADCHGVWSRETPQRWLFKGDLALRGATGNALRAATIMLELDPGQNTLDLKLEQQGRVIQVAWPLDDMDHMQVHVARVPLAWLQGVLAQVWEQGQMGQGELDANLSVDMDDAGIRSAGRYALSKAGFDSRDGSVAGDGISSQGHWSLDSRSDRTRLELDVQLRSGEVLLGPLYAKLPDEAVRLRMNANIAARGIELENVHFDDGNALRFDGMVGFDPGGEVTKLRLDGVRAVFPAAYEHYADVLLATAGFPDLGIRGMLTGSAVWDRDGWQSFGLDVDGLDLVDPSRRIGLDALTGRVDWARGEDRGATHLAWNGVSVLGLALGPARSEWRSTRGRLGLVQPVQIPFLGGQVFLSSLDWAPGAEDRQDRVAASLAYTGINLAQLSRTFGWPEFEGTVGGAIPGLDYDGERLRLDGGVSINVFDGFVDVTDLELKNPFGSAPVLTAAVGFRNIDLKPMTEVFDFGSITGRLRGQVDGLRMVGWAPTAFAAELRADQGGRISQKAVNSISNLGGGGLAGGLQTAVLRVFDSFAYKRIGLGCVLSNDVCTMTGLDKVDDGGYTIVQGSGLPHIAVIGHQHQVDWSTLVARLKAATSGGGVTIQ